LLLPVLSDSLAAPRGTYAGKVLAPGRCSPHSLADELRWALMIRLRVRLYGRAVRWGLATQRNLGDARLWSGLASVKSFHQQQPTATGMGEIQEQAQEAGKTRATPLPPSDRRPLETCAWHSY
jgi:hypothetical protein